MVLRAGEPDQLWWWLGALPFVVWVASPVLGGLWLGRLQAEGLARTSFFVVLAMIGFAGYALQWHTLFIGPADAQNALVHLFVPICQWGAVGLSVGLCRLLGRVSADKRE